MDSIAPPDQPGARLLARPLVVMSHPPDRLLAIAFQLFGLLFSGILVVTGLARGELLAIGLGLLVAAVVLVAFNLFSWIEYDRRARLAYYITDAGLDCREAGRPGKRWELPFAYLKVYAVFPEPLGSATIWLDLSRRSELGPEGVARIVEHLTGRHSPRLECIENYESVLEQLFAARRASPRHPPSPP
jgi:hypothetical protein